MENQDLPATPPKFDQPLKHLLTCRERTELQYASHFIPYLKFLEQSIGRELVIQSLQELTYQGVKAFADEIFKAAGKNERDDHGRETLLPVSLVCQAIRPDRMRILAKSFTRSRD